MIYLSLFSLTIFLGLFVDKKNHFFKLSWNLLFFLYLFIIGLSYKLGVDSNLYNQEFNKLKNLSIDQLIERNISNEFIWYFLSWLSIKFNFDFILIQFFCISVFIYSIFRFANKFSNPWIIIVFSFYFIIVFGINYPRQIITIGFFILIIDHILNTNRINKTKIILLLFLSIGIHTSAIILVPLTLFILLIYSNQKKAILKMIIILLILLIPVIIILHNTITSQLRVYLFEGIFAHASQGASIRIFSYLLPLLLLLLFFFKSISIQDKLFFLFFSSLLFLLLLLTFSFSTFADRVALYCIPAYLLGTTKLYEKCKNKIDNILFYLFSSIYVLIYFFTWYSLSHHATYWHNYKNLFFL